MRFVITIWLWKNYELAQEKVEYEDDLLDNIEKKEIEEQLYRAINGLPEQKSRYACIS